MLVKELIAELQKQDSESPVVMTWESIFMDISPENIYTSPMGVVIIDADGNSYKERITTGTGEISDRLVHQMERR